MAQQAERDRRIKIWLVRRLSIQRLCYLGMCTGFTRPEMDSMLASHRQEHAEDLMCDFVDRYLERNGDWSKLEEALLQMEENVLVAELRSKMTE